jgi:hypothetical protein
MGEIERRRLLGRIDHMQLAELMTRHGHTLARGPVDPSAQPDISSSFRGWAPFSLPERTARIDTRPSTLPHSEPARQDVESIGWDRVVSIAALVAAASLPRIRVERN